jgi:hypothetical protein
MVTAGELRVSGKAEDTLARKSRTADIASSGHPVVKR